MEIVVRQRNRVVLMRVMPVLQPIHWQGIASQKFLVTKKSLVVKEMHPSVKEKRKKVASRKIAVRSNKSVFCFLGDKKF